MEQEREPDARVVHEALEGLLDPLLHHRGRHSSVPTDFSISTRISPTFARISAIVTSTRSFRPTAQTRPRSASSWRKFASPRPAAYEESRAFGRARPSGPRDAPLTHLQVRIDDNAVALAHYLVPALRRSGESASISATGSSRDASRNWRARAPPYQIPAPQTERASERAEAQDTSPCPAMAPSTRLPRRSRRRSTASPETRCASRAAPRRSPASSAPTSCATSRPSGATYAPASTYPSASSNRAVCSSRRAGRRRAGADPLDRD